MFKRLVRRAWKRLQALARRFFNNHPANTYEEVVFRGVREVATTFGKAGAA